MGLEAIIAKRLGKSTIGFSATDRDEIPSHEKSALLAKVEPEDFVQFGMIPEFIGRFNSIANCNELSIADLIEVLSKPRNAVTKQYQALFAMEGVKLNFTTMRWRRLPKRQKMRAPVRARCA